MKHRNYKFILKGTDGEGEGTFTGLAAVYGNVDSYKEVIQPGAFTKTLADKEGEVPILWQHDSREPIGVAQLSDSREGLRADGSLVLESPVAQKAYGLLKKKALRGLSIGYDVIADEAREGIRYLTQIKLWEISLVTFPANELALVSGVKSAQEWKDFMDWLRSSDLSDEQRADLNKFLALAGPPPAATQQLSAPDLHALMEAVSKSCA